MKTKLHNLLIVYALCITQMGISSSKNECYLHAENAFEFFPTHLYNFDYEDDSGPSANQTFEINDALGLDRSYTISASSNYEVSLNATNGFTNSLIIPKTTIDLGPLDVYIRLKAGLIPNTYTGTIHIYAPDPNDTRQQLSNVVDEIINVSGEVSRKETVWNGASWSKGVPNIENMAIISGDYNTSLNGNLTAWNLNIDAHKKLTIENNTYVKIKTDVLVSGQVVVETQGALTQVEDSGVFTIKPGGSSEVNKTTSPLVNWYDYTYWSSPVSNTTVSQAFANSNRKFWFNAQNYLDILMEVGNTNTYVPGHDDVDDNGDDWNYLTGTDVLVPGVGYAATQAPSGFISGNSYNYSFNGPLNTGTITTPIYYNGDNGDNDWNFIGNPYPCAIDVDAFFAENSSVVGGAIYLWSHATLPDPNSNGNEVYNFNSDDYAIINSGSGEIAGGKPIIPKRYIPSGQGFFVKGLTNDNVVFKNSMRIADNTSNSQFFRTQNQSNKLWLSLTSDNGAFNQVLVAYVNGATNADDGVSFDTPKNLSTDAAAIIYTFIDSEPEQLYAIQGKAENSLTLEEVIPIGFYTSIDEATLYTFSIAQLEGSFLNTNTVYLKDNEQNLTHNLTNSDYVFTSLEGEFNNRFEIVFQENTLSLGIEDYKNNIAIIELGNNQFKFKNSSSKHVKFIDVYDVQGRKIYNLAGFKNVETYNLSTLSNNAYIVKFTMENDVIITKKMMKRL